MKQPGSGFDDRAEALTKQVNYLMDKVKTSTQASIDTNMANIHRLRAIVMTVSVVLVLLVLGALLLAIIWTRLEEYRWPICTFIGMTLVMVWLAGELWFFRPTAPALSAFVGASLLFISNFVWLGSHYRRRFRADNAIAAACYFAGHFLIVRSLYL